MAFPDDTVKNVESGERTGDLAEGPARTAERQQAENRRDEIAESMWVQYRAELQRRGLA